jgi:Spy/CpxP family protein refolding chaperone
MWNVTRNLILTAAAMCPLFGQEAAIGLIPGPPPEFRELRTYLSLSDAQVQSLRQVQSRRTEADQALYKQISEKYQTMNALLEANSADFARIGQLQVEIHRLQRHVPTGGEPYRSQALNVLTPEQKTKLPPLVTALQLQNTAYQAVNLNLVDGPQYRTLANDLPVRTTELPPAADVPTP